MFLCYSEDESKMSLILDEGNVFIRKEKQNQNGSQDFHFYFVEFKTIIGTLKSYFKLMKNIENF